MSEAVIGLLSAVAPLLLEKLFNYISKEFNSNRDAAENLKVLENTLLQVQTLVAYLSLLQFQHEDTTFQQRVEALTYLCYDAEDFVNKVREYENHKSFPGLSRLLERVPYRIKDLLVQTRDQLEKLANLKDEVEGALNLEKPQNNNDNLCLTVRENEVGQIKQDLISDQSENHGVSILGRRGLGKTALARIIFDGRDIKEKFTQRIWIDVYGNFNLETTKGQLANLGSKEHLFIILDNLLNITTPDWNHFWEYVTFQMNNRSVKVLVTTLNPNISQVIGTKPCYLNPLPDPVCKELIIQNAMLHKPSLTRHFLEIQLADEMQVTRCEGLPLLAKFVGQKLATPQHDERLELLEIWEWVDFKKDIFPLLKRSYKDMPPGLIKCFTYFSLFPHNHEFRIMEPYERENHNNIDDLFQLWEGEGFITPRESSLVFKKIHLNGLLERSLLQCDESGKVFKLQRLNQKFAEVASSKTCLRVEDAVPTSLPKNTRHLSLLRENLEFLEVSKKGELKRLRTILSLNDRGRTGVELKIPITIFQKESPLRVLTLNGLNIQHLPSSIKRLIHLHYLDVSRTPIRSLPDELANLFNLHVLKLTETPRLLNLPENFHRLTNLQYLGWDIGHITRLCPSKIGNLSKLQALPLFCVGIETGFFIGELKNMEHLQRSICIRNLENVQSRTDAEEAMLYKKNLLTTIELEWNETQHSSVAVEVLAGLKPHNGLSKLKITGYSGNNFPAWIANSTLKLRELHLYKCYCSSLPALGQLKALKSLVLEGMSNLIQVDDQFCGDGQDTDPAGSFQSLEFLKIEDMAELKRWTLTGLQNNMPRLQLLRFIGCTKMNEFSSLENLESLEKLEIKRCPMLETLPKLPKSLKSLVIEESDKLKRNCEVGRATWQELSWIPSVLIDCQDIFSTPRDQHHQNDQVKVGSTMDMDVDQIVIGKCKGHTEINNKEFSDASESNNDDDGRGQLKRKAPSNNSSPSTSKVEKKENDQVAKVVLSTMDMGADQTITGKGKGHAEITNNEFSDVSASNNDDDGRVQLKKKGLVAKVVLSTMDMGADQTITGKGKGQAEITNNEFSDVSASNNDDDGRGQLKKKGPSNNSSPSTSKVEKNENDQMCFEA